MFDYNCFYQSANFKMVWKGIVYVDLAGFKKAASQEDHSLSADPLFTNTLNNNFNIKDS